MLSLCSDNSDFVPVNESKILECFLEMLLEKNSKSSVKTSEYDFTIKEDFLCYIIQHMFIKNDYSVTQKEFEELLFSYHKEKGFIVKDSKFDSYFFDKNILYRHADIIFFRYSCFAHFYLAKLAIKNENILNRMISENNFLFYFNEINYLTGLERNNEKIYEKLSVEYENLFDKFKPMLEELGELGIKTNFSLEQDKLNEFCSNRVSTEESDLLADACFHENVSDSREINNNCDEILKIDDKNKFYDILRSYSIILKNSELYSKERKEKMLHNVINGYCVILALLTNPIIEELRKDSKMQDKNLKEQSEIFEDVLKISLPLIIENIAFDYVGSAKLKTFILEMIQKVKISDSFQECMLVFLYCDLRVEKCLKVLSDFVKKTTNSYLLTVTFFKTFYYYMMHYFNSQQDQILLELIAEINRKIKNEKSYSKGLIMEKIKKVRQQNDLTSKII